MLTAFQSTDPPAVVGCPGHIGRAPADMRGFVEDIYPRGYHGDVTPTKGEPVSLGNTLRKIFTKPYPTVRPREVAALLESGAVLLDVREPDEWRAGHAPKARHIPLGQLATRIGELPKDRPLVTICRSGMRSARAAGLLAGQGREVINVAGGMRAWATDGLTIVAKGGRPGRVA